MPREANHDRIRVHLADEFSEGRLALDQRGLVRIRVGDMARLGCARAQRGRNIPKAVVRGQHRFVGAGAGASTSRELPDFCGGPLLPALRPPTQRRLDLIPRSGYPAYDLKSTYYFCAHMHEIIKYFLLTENQYQCLNSGLSTCDSVPGRCAGIKKKRSCPRSWKVTL